MNGSGPFMVPNGQQQQVASFGPAMNMTGMAPHQQPQTLPFQPVPMQKHQSMQHDADLDDSGIGMSLMDEDLTATKFGITGPHVAMQGMGAPQEMRVEPL
ncbi:hypothetical protein KC319_g6888 [Hortaea werneckii]|nr:hypothetical protein KC319_g6888 [Hortaea werneckii]